MDDTEKALKESGFKPQSDVEMEQQKKSFEAIGVYYDPLFEALNNWVEESKEKNKGIVLD